MAPKKSAGGKASTGKKEPQTVPDTDYIVFGNESSKKKQPPATDETPGPPRPDPRKVIGGASWTGKLPGTLLSEHCQRQKWSKPDYSMRQMPAKDDAERLYRSSVTLSKTDPKTRESTKLPPFQLPASHVHLADQETALEARHFAAAYALFRISSMKSIHMTLPPQYRDLWKGEFDLLKKEDVKQDHGWKYDADPFAAEAKRKEIQAGMEKRKAEREKQEAKPAHASLVLPNQGGLAGPAWQRAPRLEMGQKIRVEIESIIRRMAVWNPNGVSMSKNSQSVVVAELSKLGFRPAHVREALLYCKDREEVLEWLLIHVPEDDLPNWTLPPGYTAGITLANNDLVQEAKVKRLALAGFSIDQCTAALEANDGHEVRAAEALQSSLVPSMTVPLGDSSTPEEATWETEMSTLEAIMGDKFTLRDPQTCSIIADSNCGRPLTLTFRKPSVGYPESAVPVISIAADRIPAYIRLSATRRAVIHARENLLGDSMIYNITEWLETTMPSIIEEPGSLVDLLPDSSADKGEPSTGHAASAGTGSSAGLRRRMNHAKNDRRTDAAVFEAWKARQSTPEQLKMLQARQALPAWSKQEEILACINSKQVTIVSGETGSGKSTQTPQFILDGAIEALHGSSAGILCTQPRRVAALSLADRVSSERCSSVGDEVGYIIRGDSKISPQTKVTFMTTGVLLRRLQTSSNIAQALAGVSHVIIDEVHERSLDTDFLLALLRDGMKANAKLKIILMSATIDAEIFSQYFGGDKNVAKVHIEGRTYPVQDFYLDDVLHMTQKRQRFIDGDDDQIETGTAIRALGMGINYDLIATLVQQIDHDLGSTPGGILIFLPGTMEIDRCLRTMSSIANVVGLPLHASLLPAEQRRVFPRAPTGMRKVIAATNVAETSITIEDIVAVIDTGRVKETNYDSSNNIVRLEEVWASQAACKQRRGRAGRVRAGKCYKLFTRNVESSMAPKNVPEICRVPLEQLCLSVKATQSDRDVGDFLAHTLTPPESGSVVNALKMLHRIGALDDDRLTALGTYLAMIPADLRCAKLLVYGGLFGCLESCLTVAAILTVKSPFNSPRDKRDDAKEARSSFSTGGGDLLLDLAAFNEWTEQSQHRRYREAQAWCNTQFLSQQTLRDIASTRSQLLDSLKEAGLVAVDFGSSRFEARQVVPPPKDNQVLLRALIAGALNPQVAEIKFPDKKYIASMSGAKELDPEAKTIKYFNEENGRVFVHPSSILFDAQTFSGAAKYISYFTKMATSKTFIRDLTPFNAYSLLLFGGNIEVDTSGAGIIVDGWLRLRGWARIGVLISRLRALLDDELRRRIDDPRVEFGSSRLLSVVTRLVELNGQDQ